MYKGKRSRNFRDRQSFSPKSESCEGNSSETIGKFQLYAKELESKQDRHERIVKISRDITIESKRLIFFLHTYQPTTLEKENILVEAESRLVKIVQIHFVAIIIEVQNLDTYQYLRAFCFGVQEFIEAFSFYFYLRYNKLLTFEEVGRFLCHHLSKVDENSTNEPPGSAPVHAVIGGLGGDIEETTKLGQLTVILEEKCQVCAPIPDKHFFVTMIDYVLGISDLTGELMRYCINLVACGQFETAYNVTRFMTNLYTSMLSVGHCNRDYTRKMHTFMQSIGKVEMACYAVKVRGSEMPKHMIINVLEQGESDIVDF